MVLAPLETGCRARYRFGDRLRERNGANLRAMTNKMIRGFPLAVALTAVLGSVPTPAGAVPIDVDGAGPLQADVEFALVSGNLQVTVINTSTADVLNPSQVLTAVFFTLAGDTTLTTISAVLGTGSTVLFDPDGQPAGGIVGGEWAYGSGLLGPGGTNQGISSAGFDPPSLFGAANFPGNDLDGNAASVDGVGYGITSSVDTCPPGNTAVCTNPLIRNSVVFTLGNLPLDDFTLGAISNVRVQYGTSLAVPEPGTLLLLGSGLMVLGLLGRRRAVGV